MKNIGIAHQRQKFYYDAKHSNDKEKYKVGTLVLLQNSKKLSKKGSKMEPNLTDHTISMILLGRIPIGNVASRVRKSKFLRL